MRTGHRTSLSILRSLAFAMSLVFTGMMLLPFNSLGALWSSHQKKLNSSDKYVQVMIEEQEADESLFSETPVSDTPFYEGDLFRYQVLCWSDDIYSVQLFRNARAQTRVPYSVLRI